MKSYLFLSFFICYFFNSTAQKSTITFNQYKGLDITDKKKLSDVYHNMKDLNYHYFNLVSKTERAQNNPHILLKKAKARALIITNYYIDSQKIPSENLVVIYGAKTLQLSLYKSRLST